MIDIVNICGIPYKIELQTTHFEADAQHFGEIDYKRGVITIADDMSEEITKETLYHEITHGMLVHIGRSDLTMDEQLVQALGNAIYQTFEIKSNCTVDSEGGF